MLPRDEICQHVQEQIDREAEAEDDSDSGSDFDLVSELDRLYDEYEKRPVFTAPVDEDGIDVNNPLEELYANAEDPANWEETIVLIACFIDQPRLMNCVAK